MPGQIDFIDKILKHEVMRETIFDTRKAAKPKRTIAFAPAES
jgi:hypothetical protein